MDKIVFAFAAALAFILGASVHVASYPVFGGLFATVAAVGIGLLVLLFVLSAG